MSADPTENQQSDLAPKRKGQFEKGKSGNPRGRPKKAISTLKSDLARAQRETVEVTKDGRRRRVRKGALAAIQLVNKAATGDLTSIRLMNQIGCDDGSEEEARPVVLTASDMEIVARLVARIRATDFEGESDGKSEDI